MKRKNDMILKHDARQNVLKMTEIDENIGSRENLVQSTNFCLLQLFLGKKIFPSNSKSMGKNEEKNNGKTATCCKRAEN